VVQIATHAVEYESGKEVLMTFTGAETAREYGKTHKRVTVIRTLAGTVEYGPEDD
jgi:hypothetical protein